MSMWYDPDFSKWINGKELVEIERDSELTYTKLKTLIKHVTRTIMREVYKLIYTLCLCGLSPH